MTAGLLGADANRTDATRSVGKIITKITKMSKLAYVKMFQILPNFGSIGCQYRGSKRRFVRVDKSTRAAPATEADE